MVCNKSNHSSATVSGRSLSVCLVKEEDSLVRAEHYSCYTNVFITDWKTTASSGVRYVVVCLINFFVKYCKQVYVFRTGYWHVKIVGDLHEISGHHQPGFMSKQVKRTLLMLIALALDSTISGRSGVTWVLILSASQAARYFRCKEKRYRLTI